MRTRFGRFVLLIAALTLPRFAVAQETISYASIAGRVTDSQGAVVSGAQVTARQMETNVSTTATTDREGRFRFAYLKTGTYEVVVQVTGFAKGTQRVSAAGGSAFDLSIALSVEGVADVVNVTADATVIEAARSQIASTVSAAETRTLPMNGRNSLDLALLIPGVSPTNVGGGTQLFPETSAVPGVGISVGSQRNLSNNFMVDGLSANDDAAGLSGIVYGVDAIDQFQVVTSGGQAEMGRALGGYVNIVTRSGGNAVTGIGYGLFRDDRFAAPNPLLQAAGTVANGTLPMHQDQYGGTVGGPLARNRTFFFSNVEQRRLDQSGLVTVSQANVDTINARLAAVNYPGPAVTTGIFPNPIHTTTFVAKVDHNLSAGDHVSLKYSAYAATSQNARGAGGTATPSASAGIDSLDQTVTAGNVWALSSSTVLESRGQFAYSDLLAPPTDPIGPAVSISGVASFGTLSGSPTARVSRMYQLVNNLTHQSGTHALRAGVDVLYNDVTITYPRSIRGGYSFSNMATFLAGVYTSTGFTQTFGDTVTSQTNPNVGVYAQDEWHAGGAVTVNVGLRYELQWLQTIATDTNNLSPRVGVVWTPSRSRRSVVRANAGRFFDRVPLRALANALLSAGNTTDLAQLRQVNVTLAPTQTGAPVFPAILPAFVPTTTLVNLTTMDPHLQNAYSDQSSVELEQQLWGSGTVSVGYEHLKGHRLIMSINQNVPSCVVVGSNNGCRPISAYANDSRYSSAGASDYNGLHVSWVQRPSKWGGYRVSYAYSRSFNNLGEAFFSSPIDPFDLSKDWGRSDDDQRHRLTALASLNSPTGPATNWLAMLTHDFTVSTMVQAYSALPFNITTGANTIQGTAARPTVDGVFIPRNAGIGTPFSTVSLRVSRTVPVSRSRLEGFVEAFNLFNRRNDVARITVFGTGSYPDNPAANYGQVTVVGDSRSLQFGLRLTY